MTPEQAKNALLVAGDSCESAITLFSKRKGNKMTQEKANEITAMITELLESVDNGESVASVAAQVLKLGCTIQSQVKS